MMSERILVGYEAQQSPQNSQRMHTAAADPGRGMACGRFASPLGEQAFPAQTGGQEEVSSHVAIRVRDRGARQVVVSDARCLALVRTFSEPTR
jgi:hypothetical protein